MGAYLTIEENISDMLIDISKNENIQKLLYNMTDTALTDSLPVGFDSYSLLNNQIYDVPKMPDPTMEQGCFIMVHLDDSNFAGTNNVYQYNMIVSVFVICHIDSWILDGAKRPYRLLEELNKTISNTSTKSTRGYWQIYEPAKFLGNVNDSFNAYRIKWIVTNESKDCGDYIE